MRKIKRLIVGFLTAIPCAAQSQGVDTINVPLTNFTYVDSLVPLLKVKPDGPSKVKLLGDLCVGYAFNQADSGLFYGQMGIELAKRIGDNAGKAYCTQSYSMALWSFGNYNTALQFGLDAFRQYEELDDNKGLAYTHFVLANVYRDFGDYKRALLDVYK